jgi:uncharacterized protein
MLRPWIIIFLLGISVQSAFADPSFDCHQAKSKLDLFICSNKDLSQLDSTMAQAYEKAKVGDPEHAQILIADQKVWLSKDRSLNQCKVDHTESLNQIKEKEVSCLISIYQNRIMDIGNKNYLIPRHQRRYFLNLTQDAFNKHNMTWQGENACKFFKIAPENALAMYFPLSETGFGPQPMCQDETLRTKYLNIKKLFEMMDLFNGDTYYRNAEDNVYYEKTGDVVVFMMTLAAVDPYPSMGAQGLDMVDSDFYPLNIKNWSEQGRWNKKQFAIYQQTLTKAIADLTSFYEEKYHIDSKQAKKAARYYIGQLMGGYQSVVDVDAYPFYPSSSLNTSDLDNYIKMRLTQGKAPNLDTKLSSPITLSRLLVLAIVNDYPVNVIKHLMHDGALVNPDFKSNAVGANKTDTPLMLAMGRANIVALLLKAGANPNSQNWFGKTALMYAIQAHDVASIQLLLRHGADINQTTSPESSHEQCDVFADDSVLICAGILAGNRTALMYAAWQGTPQIIRLLVDAKANKAMKDTQGQMAVDYLAKNSALNSAARLQMTSLLKP